MLNSSIHSLSSSSLFNESGSKRSSRKIGRQLNTIATTQRHLIELFGPQLPVSVAESFAHVPSARTNASVNINADCGWAWYVCKRELIVWQNTPSTDKIPPTVISRELLLPASDLALNANHVTVFFQPGCHAPSCVAVSPEGIVRYWHVVGQQQPWIEVNANLGGEEVCGVVHVAPVGCIAVTTSATLALIRTASDRNMPVVHTEMISRPQGWLSGIGRRVSSILWSSSSTPDDESRTVKLLTSRISNNEWHLFLLAGMKLQLRTLVHEKCEFKYEFNLLEIICPLFFDNMDFGSVDQQTDCEVTITDIRLSDCGLTVLAASNAPRNYKLLDIPCHEMMPPSEAIEICSLSKHDINCFEDRSGKIVNLQFLLLPTTALIFSKWAIVAVPMESGGLTDGDRLEIPGGTVIGGHMYKEIPLFFSTTYGFVSVSPIDTACMDLFNSSNIEAGALTPNAISLREPKVSTKHDYVAAVRSACILYSRKNMSECKYLIEKEFPVCQMSPVDSPLASTLVKISLDLINEKSYKDTRWGGGTSQSSKLCGINSLDIKTQLGEKQQAHDLLIQFVHELPLIDRLGKVTKMGVPVDTIHVLTEHNEKIVAALVFRELQAQYSSVILTAIQESVRPLEQSGVPSQDIFYRFVSFVDEGIRVLTKQCLSACYNSSLEETIRQVTATNCILVEIISAIVYKRESKTNMAQKGLMTWLSTPGPSGLFDFIMNQAKFSYDLMKPEITDELAQSLFKLIDAILYLQKDCPPMEKYFQVRTTLISLLIEKKLFTLAKSLAYKFKEFNLLVALSYQMGEDKLVYEYMMTFGDEGFCEEVFKWHIRAQKKDELLNLNVPPAHIARLDKFLRQYGNLYWLYQMKKGNSEKASKVLTKYSINYSHDITKTQRMLSMAKLLTMAAGVDSFNHFIDDKLFLIDIQKFLPKNLTENIEGNPIRVLDPLEIIQLIIAPQNNECTGLHFKKALDLLPYIDSAEGKQENLRLKIWAKSILIDSEWQIIKTDSPIEEIMELVIFQLMSLVVSLDESHYDIPTTEQLLDYDGLEEFRQDPNKKYLLELGYEHLRV